MKKHKQTWVKVNAQADIGISSLVALLSEINTLCTLDSCEDSGGWAYVYFRFGGYQTMCKFLFGGLAPALAKKYGEDVVLSVEVANGSEPIGKISFRKELTIKLVRDLRFQINAYHKCS